MRNFVIFSLAAFVLLTSQTAVAEEDSSGSVPGVAVKHGTVGQVQGGQRVNPRYYTPARSYRQPNNFRSNSLLRTLLLVLVFQSLSTTAAPPPVTTPEPDTTVVTVTTAVDPCMAWKEVDSCRYKVFDGHISWNEAGTRCQNTCNSKLAHEKVRSAAALNPVLAAVSYNDQPIWMGISDQDSFGPIRPKWDKTTEVTTLMFIAMNYVTSFGSAGCGLYVPPQNPLNLYTFDRCTFTGIFTPKQYLCEVCP